MAKNLIIAQYLCIARHNHLFPGSGNGDIQLAVDDGSVFHKAVAGKKIELPDVLDGETVDDDITLTALIALHGVDADLFQFRNAQLFDAFAHHGYLVAIGYDDAHRLLGIKPVAVETVDAAKHIHYDFCLVGIDLVRHIRFLTESGREEDHAVFLQQVIKCIF